MKFLKSSFVILTALISVGAPFYRLSAQDQNPEDTVAFVSPFSEANERCFNGHGQGTYIYTNENLGREVKALMFSERIINRNDFYRSNHRSFGCTDCHSEEYTKFPHAGELRMEQQYNCIDCHGGDENFARFKFEEIEAQYRQSIHFKMEEEGFSCWKCHDPHTYILNARTSNNLAGTILYDNNICLNCHSNFNHFQLLTDRDEINILSKHEWLPNQEAHFRSVRCIECHTEVNNNVLISHLITAKEKAVKKCNECHSQNSLLMTSLYKFKSREQRKSGFLNGVILNESYVIGANRNKYLNVLSIIVFTAVALIMCVHLLLRIFKK
jgi:hypothetical protein